MDLQTGLNKRFFRETAPTTDLFSATHARRVTSIKIDARHVKPGTMFIRRMLSKGFSSTFPIPYYI